LRPDFEPLRVPCRRIIRPLLLRENFEFAFLARVPVGGGVVIECLDTNGSKPQRYWFTIGPVTPVPIPARLPAKTSGKP
jgi:hypothetical protein